MTGDLGDEMRPGGGRLATRVEPPASPSWTSARVETAAETAAGAPPDATVKAAVARIPRLARLSPGDYAVRRLSSFTNATYRLDVGTESFALRVPGVGTAQYIDRAVEGLNARIAAAAGVAAPVEWFDDADGLMLTRWVNGRTTSAGRLRRPRVGGRAVTALARVHALPQPFCGRYDVFDVIRSYQTVLAAARLPLPPVFAELAGPIVTIEQALSAGAVPLVPCHNDPCPGNIIDTGSGICLIDWEYAGMGDPMGDLADLSVEARYASHDDKLMLKTYYGGRVPRAAKSRLALYKVMSDCAWGVWSFVQLVHAKPGVDYRQYGLRRLARARRRIEAPKFARHLDAVAGAPSHAS